MDRVKKNKKKGFTLVELMIVVVIMVILAAAATPIFKGYLDRAKQARYLANCRTIYVAAQTTIQDYSIAEKPFGAEQGVNAAYNPATEMYTNFANDVQRLAQLPIVSGESYVISIDEDTLSCTKIVYSDGKGTSVTFTPDASAVQVKEPAA